MEVNVPYQILENQIKEIADLRFAAAVLQWDQETYMPASGAGARSRQGATLSEIAHLKFTDPALLALMNKVDVETISEDAAANLRLLKEDVEKSAKLPAAFIRKLSETTSKGFHDWMEARKHNNFELFAGSLTELVALKQQEAAYIGFEAHPYDALLNEYEKGSTVKMLDKTFQTLQAPLSALLNAIRQVPQVSNACMHQHFPHQQQWDFGMELLQNIGYDLSAGRQDLAEHPFTTNFSSRDVRITTRVDENNLSSMLWSTIHEAGHALYEQGLLEEQYGMPLGEAASLGIHESQSRLWENNVGRSVTFWEHYYPQLQAKFPIQLASVTVMDFYKAMNLVQPSLIRTEADELTYHFHVMIRYEIEKKLIAGDLGVRDIPAYWNELYKNMLGVIVPDAIHGCLQDVHWSHGSFGYFPTYSLGSMYAAQFYGAAEQQIPNLKEQIQQGNSAQLLRWLRENVHQYGRKYTSEELCMRITGTGLNSNYFIAYAREKYSGIYGVEL